VSSRSASVRSKLDGLSKTSARPDESHGLNNLSQDHSGYLEVG